MERTIPPVLRLLMVPGIAVILCLYLAPLVTMLSMAFTEPHLGLSNAEWLAQSSAIRSIAWSTLRFSAIASAISVCLGFYVAYVIWIGRTWLSQMLMTIVLISFWLSVLVRCFSLILVLGPNGPLNALSNAFGFGDLHLIRNQVGVLIGMAHYLTPFAVLTILLSLRSIDPAIISAARSMGATRRKIFLSIIFPLAAPGVAASFSVCFVISLGFYITPALLGGGRVVMIAEFITFYVQNVLDWGKASILAIALMGAMALSYGAFRIIRHATKHQLGRMA